VVVYFVLLCYCTSTVTYSTSQDLIFFQPIMRLLLTVLASLLIPQSIIITSSFVFQSGTQRRSFLSIHIPVSLDPSALAAHHVAVKTRNITAAMQFYSLFDFEATHKFRAGPARAAWLQNGGPIVLELIEVPSYILQETEGHRKRALDLIKYPGVLGYNHVAFDVTDDVKKCGLSSLDAWIDTLNSKSLQMFGYTLRVAVKSRQQLIGREVYEIAFICDADGSLIEFIFKTAQLKQEISSGWEPVDDISI